MGAIAGIFHPGTPKPVDPARIVAMTTAQAHRGPDGSGVWTAPGVGLGHRRLAILDIAGGHQPMMSADGTLSLSYDGEIYNFEALRDDLRALGAVFVTQGDTEVILHAWSAWGPAMLDRLDGMFALALHDARRQCLFLARDRLGVKPLHYTELSDGGIAFASELKGLLAHPLVRRSPDIRAIEDYLAFGYVPDDACLVAGVHKLPAGSMLSIQRGRPVPPPSRWWDIDFSRQETGKTKAFAEELTGLLRDAVRTRMVADVPLGAALSGDGGSAAVVALMAEASKRAVSTCALGTSLMAGGDPDSIEQIARRFATDHCSGGDTVGEGEPLDRLVAMFDEPFADPAAIGRLRLSELARDRIRVMLCGDGALEVLGGHPGYGIYHAQERMRAIIPKSIWTGPLGGIARKSGWKNALGAGSGRAQCLCAFGQHDRAGTSRPALFGCRSPSAWRSSCRGSL